MNWKRMGNSLEIKYTFWPWYKRLWYWLRRKKPMTAGSGEYTFNLPREPQPGDEWGEP